MTEFAIRAAEASDIPQIRHVYRTASLSNDGEREVLLANPDYLVWRGGVGPGSVCLVAEVDSTIIGFATRTAEGELEDLFVVPEHKRRGVATALIDRLVAEARASGIARIEVDANPHALAFYRSAGFVEVGRISTQFGEGIRMVLAVQ
ncbi:GNAT family N-acetyltransferase [Smaragdicoccus niigatensis]|uniref:GNAT family N-acetyltransferase n=1 Tax=Smaragdicoccus niigatensis TaxID=359359 RepID=UPI00037AA28B|nr:GNAT family N-acetyltransferase [Smaragdicoccus niigatensis]